MQTTLIFVRHGESEANEKGIFAGHLDMALSARGQQQAIWTARHIAENFSVDAIYSSDLQRAYHTALPIGQLCGVEIVKSPQLREIFAGEWEGLSFQKLQERYGDSYRVWREDIGRAHPEKGESVEALSNRIWESVQEIAHKQQGKTVVIATHATPIRTLLCRLQGLGVDQMKQVGWVSNASITVVRTKGNQWRLEQVGADTHLAGLKTHLPANV